MPELKSLAVSIVLYPLVYLALVICGALLCLPFAQGLFLFVATLDGLLNLGLAVLFALSIAIHCAKPDLFAALTASTADGLRKMTRGQRVRERFSRVLCFASIVLLAATSHPLIAFCLLSSAVGFAVFKRLALRAHPLSERQSAVDTLPR